MILRIFGCAKATAYNPQFISNPVGLEGLARRNQLGLELLPLHPAPLCFFLFLTLTKPNFSHRDVSGSQKLIDAKYLDTPSFLD